MKYLKQLSYASLLFCSNTFISAQTFQKENDGMVFNTESNASGVRKIRLKVWFDNVIQVIVSPAEQFSNNESLIISELIPDVLQWNIIESDNTVSLTTQKIIAQIDKKTAKFSFLKTDGKLIMAENEKNLEPADVMGEKCYHIRQSFNYSDGESLYGLGSYMDGEVRLNGKKVNMLQRNREDVVPVILSTNGYGLLWDNYSLSEFNDTKGEYYLWSEVADEINYYFIYGENTDQIVDSYRRLTGKAPMYPKWAFGYMQSKQKYNTQDEEGIRKVMKNCAIVHYNNLKMDDLLSGYIGNLDGFIDFLGNNWGWKIEYDRDTKTLIADENKNFCVCPMVNKEKGISSAAICYCSEGFAEKMFSRISENPVFASVISSIHKGDKSCRYKIKFS